MPQLMLGHLLPYSPQPEWKARLQHTLLQWPDFIDWLQQGLCNSSQALLDDAQIVLLHQHTGKNRVHIKLGVFYSGMIAGCSCADDPTPLDKENEYCELLLEINTENGSTEVYFAD